MAVTLFDLTYEVARELADENTFISSAATGGDTSTLEDSYYLATRGFDDDYFAGGTLWIVKTTDGNAPQGEYSIVDSYDSALYNAVLRTPLSANIDAGDRYALLTDKYALYDIIASINSVLSEIWVSYTDMTIVTERDKTEYVLPSGVMKDYIEVFIQQNPDDSDDNRWERRHDWYVENTANGKVLIFRNQPLYQYALKIKYWLPHPELVEASDTLRKEVDKRRVVLDAAFRLLEADKSIADEDKTIEAKLKLMEREIIELKWSNPSGPTLFKLSSY